MTERAAARSHGDERRHAAAWGIAGLTVALSFALAITKVSSYDTWVHLSLGRWMAENGQVPRANLLSYTQPARAAIDHQWLFQAGLYGLWRAGGMDGATLVKAALVAAAFGVVLATARRKGSDLVVAAVVVLMAAGAARFRFTLRPQVVGLLLLALYAFVLERWRAGVTRGLLALVPLQVVWANVHGSAILGIGLAIGFAVGESIRVALARRSEDVSPAPHSRHELAWLWGVALALVPLTLLNPGGAQILSLPFTHASKQMASGLKELLQDRAAVAWSDLCRRHACFTVLGVATLGSLAASVWRRDVTETVLCLGSLAAAMFSERFIDLFAVAAAPIAARNLSSLFRRTLSRIERPLLYALGVAALMGVAAVATASGGPTVLFGLGIADGHFPEHELAFIQEHYPAGNLFNEFEHGGYIAWRTRRPVFIDSRGMLAYEPQFFRSYVDAWESRDAWRALVERWQVRVALVGRRSLQAMFRADDRWEQVFQGPVCAVFALK